MNPWLSTLLLLPRREGRNIRRLKFSHHRSAKRLDLLHSIPSTTSQAGSHSTASYCSHGDGILPLVHTHLRPGVVGKGLTICRDLSQTCEKRTKTFESASSYRGRHGKICSPEAIPGYPRIISTLRNILPAGGNVAGMFQAKLDLSNE